ncbi:hypothetical protein LX32DRAFT_687864 [Colletotrichum zoysiae]|uniref:Uncharacterized protein n=1 Tax=Colletotrichum zoysiae TaxID=1216348 RepID=A0AAD9LWY1_9PEZI|nr:hypothetical protein LX32DRAFT_687864 [Colletotrichum zoysiae]
MALSRGLAWETSGGEKPKLQKVRLRELTKPSLARKTLAIFSLFLAQVQGVQPSHLEQALWWGGGKGFCLCGCIAPLTDAIEEQGSETTRLAPGQPLPLHPCIPDLKENRGVPGRDYRFHVVGTPIRDAERVVEDGLRQVAHAGRYGFRGRPRFQDMGLAATNGTGTCRGMEMVRPDLAVRLLAFFGVVTESRDMNRLAAYDPPSSSLTDEAMDCNARERTALAEEQIVPRPWVSESATTWFPRVVRYWSGTRIANCEILAA